VQGGNNGSKPSTSVRVPHRDDSGVQRPAKVFPHMKLLCLLFMVFLVLTQSKETIFLIGFGVSLQ
jgi:hypothetical protein